MLWFVFVAVGQSVWESTKAKHYLRQTPNQRTCPSVWWGHCSVDRVQWPPIILAG